MGVGWLVTGETVLLADALNHKIKRISINDNDVATTTTLAGSGTPGFEDGAGERVMRNPCTRACDSL
jgi:hypothetical protein